MKKKLNDQYAGILISINTALFGIAFVLVVFAWMRAASQNAAMLPNFNDTITFGESLFVSSVALLLGGFFYSLVVLRPGLDSKNLERDQISEIAHSLEIQVMTDPLTGVSNRRYFENAI